MRKLTKLLTVMAVLFMGFSQGAFAWEPLIQESLTAEEISKRLQPTGSVDVEGGFVEEAVAVGPGAGKKRYRGYCKACHAAGIAGAPKFRDAQDWGPRLALGADALLQSVINGKGTMPARGGCNSCSDDELRLAIEHMVPQS